VTGRPRLEVAEVFRSCDTEFRKTYGLSPDQNQVLSALIQCRTAALGGHVDECDQCGERRISYNSCRNRHCPKCQGSQAAEWLDAQRSHLLPVPYAHVVFTLPKLLAPLALQNRRTVYGLLFEAASKTLLEIAADPRHLGARIGFLALLHTWGQKLDHHPHLHCVVPAGGLSLDGTHWVACPPKFFLPVRVLSRVFRGKLLALLAKAYKDGKLSFHGSLEPLAHETAFNRLLAKARSTEWVVYAKPPFGGPEQVLKYLARYTHKVAISNRRLVSFEEGVVRFRYKDYARGNGIRILRLSALEFTRRFLLHALPKGFVRIRRYGLLANAQRENNLARCRHHLGADTPTPGPAEPETPPDTPAEAGTDSHDPCTSPCPVCGAGSMRRVETLPCLRSRNPPSPMAPREPP
jgi:hypothetical protein